MTFVVDTHTHAIAADTTRYPLAPVGGHQSEWSVKRPVSFEALLAAMDAAKIDRAIVVQASTVSPPATSCRYCFSPCYSRSASPPSVSVPRPR